MYYYAVRMTCTSNWPNDVITKMRKQTSFAPITVVYINSNRSLSSKTDLSDFVKLWYRHTVFDFVSRSCNSLNWLIRACLGSNVILCHWNFSIFSIM